MKLQGATCVIWLAGLAAVSGCSSPDPAAEAIATIKASGGELRLDDQGRPVSVDLRESEAGPDVLAAIGVLSEVRSINCSNAHHMTGEGLAALASLPHLETLYLGGTGVDDEGLAQIQNLKSLKTLHLGHTKITDKGMPALDPLTGLQTLVLSDTAISDKGIVQLRDLRELSTLIVKRTKITPRGISELRRTLPNTRVDD